ncbi:flagellar biosynthesis protein FlhB [Noviherbaspirillum aridicola]|uniref:Flagellar biosynthetic protein FlhB n=1 Tax=Noviherbaspirillum aridicola TaxID=2849687 RepID=A0ABQ4Q613_9BURK|nr:flagellar biosynthesis protein FlhB [Noviherbaspirillum aridicola]GIZ52649.1 flagellar biosynthesis protein FlhB [Noviherbaspirillum aridicola]
MAEDSDLEKTEPASPRKLEQAREEGDIPRSRELATCTVLLAAGLGLWVTGEQLVRRLNHMLAEGLSFEREQAFDFSLLLMRLGDACIDVLIALAPLAGILLLVALGSPLLIGGWLFSSKSLAPKFARLNPLSGIGNMFSTRSLVELIKAIGKTVLVGVISWTVIAGQLEPMLALSTEPLQNGAAHLGDMLVIGFITIVFGLVVIALIDVPYQLWHYANKLKMTREELRQESKESDGDPQVKARIRQLQREMARRRMMSEVPTADVVVTNPTHYAVALRYTEGKNRAPVVVAKGADEVAAKIRELAAENNVALLEAPPLARALYKHTELGDEIPAALYTAVAEVLAYVFQLRVFNKQGGARPNMPTELQVPADMDPANAAAASGGAR